MHKTQVQHNQYGTVIPSRTLFYCLTNFLSGPVQYRTGNPRGGFPRVRGLPDYPLPAGRCGLTGHSRNANIAQTGSHRHPRSHPTTSDIRWPDTPELLSLRIHSQSRVYKYVRAFTILLLYTSGLSPYCCSRCPGFHSTAVLLLTELCTNRYPHGLP